MNSQANIHNLGYLNGVALYHSPVLGPNRTREIQYPTVHPLLAIFCARVPNKKQF